MRLKLTDAAIQSYKARGAKYSVGDAACPGLCIRITVNGIKSFVFSHRSKVTGKVEHITLGRYPDIGLTQAREAANDARKVAAAGGTPLAPHAQRAEREKKSPTYADVLARYHADRLTPLRTGAKTRQTLARIGRTYGWSERAINSISDDEAAQALADIAITRGKRAMANQAQSLLHALFKWAKQPGRKYVTVNRFADLEAPGGPRVERERFLSADEIRLLWHALDQPERCEISRDAATALKLVLTTAARPGMIAGMVGAEMHDLSGPSKHGPHWSLSAARMKAKKAFITPLSPLALELLRPWLKRDLDARLFDLGRDDLDQAARKLVTKLKMERWTPHDLRRTAGTILDGEGYSLEQIGALLAHSRKGVTRIYARFSKFGLRREMATVIERSLRETLACEPTATKVAA